MQILEKMNDNIFNYDGILNSSTLDEFLEKYKKRQTFLNTIDATFNDTDIKNIKHWITNPDNKGIKPTFIYKNNKNGFRDLNENFNSDILCFGCSVTYGVGLPYEYRWTDILKKELNVRLNNLGIPGLNLTDILILFFGLTKFVKPKYCIFILPDYKRETLSKIDEDGKIVFFNAFDNYRVFLKKHINVEEYNGCENYYNIPISYRVDKFVNNIHTLLLFSELLDIKVIINSWSEQTHQILERLKLNTFKNVNLIQFFPTDEKGRDIKHPGIIYHYNLSQEIKKFINL